MKSYGYLLLVLTAILLVLLTGCGDGTVHIPQRGMPGPQGPAGPTGDRGPSGTQGPIGLTGPAGQDSTPISFVQLCGSCVGSYPSVFPEIGLCINDELYGVYSANNGFLVKLPPGSYSSNGIGCTCTLTIQPHCQVN
jgi:hypothetical protein